MRQKENKILFSPKYLMFVITVIAVCTSMYVYMHISSSVFMHVAPTLEHRASLKRFVSLQFLNLRQSVGLLGGGITRRKAAIYTET
jgi:hypothetical protein